MALTYLSGDDIGKKKKSSGGGGGGGKKAARQQKRTGRKETRQQKRATKTKKTKAEKKAGRKRVLKKVAKVAVAPARTAFLTIARLNLLKTSSMIARVWNTPGGKEKLTKFWEGFGGDINKFKGAVSKGAKQTINADDIGVAPAAVIATATPILIALAPILKEFKAARSKKEVEEFNDGVEKGRKDLSEDDDVPKTKASMPKNKDVGIVADKNGQSSEDTSQKEQPESKTGGYDGESAPKEKGAKDDDDEKEESGGSKTAAKKKDAEKTLASGWSPLGFFFWIAMYSMMIAPKIENAALLILLNVIVSYSFVAMISVPFAISTKKNLLQRIAYKISYSPMDFLNNKLQNLKHGIIRKRQGQRA